MCCLLLIRELKYLISEQSVNLTVCYNINHVPNWQRSCQVALVFTLRKISCQMQPRPPQRVAWVIWTLCASVIVYFELFRSHVWSMLMPDTNRFIELWVHVVLFAKSQPVWSWIFCSFLQVSVNETRVTSPRLIRPANERTQTKCNPTDCVASAAFTNSAAWAPITPSCG